MNVFRNVREEHHGKAIVARRFRTGFITLCAAMLPFVVQAAPPSDAAPPFPPLSVDADGSRIPGKFVWADLVTDDADAAMKFYRGLLGWKFSGRGDYRIASNRGRPVAGVLRRDRPANNPQAKPLWFGFISVDDISKARTSTTRAGGRVIAAARTFPGRGEQAVFADPEGAVFGVIRSASGDPGDSLAEPGDWIWIQLLSRNADKAARFYRNIGGYTLHPNSATNRSSDIILGRNDIARATIRTLSPAAIKQGVRPTWLPFVRVNRLDRTLSRVEGLGGKIRVAPRADLLDGKVAVIADPTGAAIGLMEWNAPSSQP